MRSFFGLGLLIAVLLPAKAEAQEPPPLPAEKKPGPVTKGQTEAVGLEQDDDEDRPEGWTPGIQIGTGFNVLQSRGVVGLQDGFTIALSASIDAELEFNEGIHEWRNGLRLAAGLTRSPALDEFEKSNDALEFETQYLLHALELFGPYARVEMYTSMFPSAESSPAPVTYLITNADGSKTSRRTADLELTDPFSPLTFREGVGVFVQPVEEDPLAIELKAGLGSEQAIASGLAIVDDATTAEIEAKELTNTYVIGAEAVVDVWGYVDKNKRISYGVGADVLIPFKTSDLPPGDNRELLELTGIRVDAGLDVRLFDWASLGYKFGVEREPMLVDELQVTNSLLITIGGVFGSKAPVPPPACACPK